MGFSCYIIYHLHWIGSRIIQSAQCLYIIRLQRIDYRQVSLFLLTGLVFSLYDRQCLYIMRLERIDCRQVSFFLFDGPHPRFPSPAIMRL
jgi:hypothetical protein